MFMVDVDKLTKKTIDDGGILSLLYFDLHGKKKEELQQLGAGFVGKLLKEKGVVYAAGEIDEPVENNGVYSTSIKVKILTKDFNSLLLLCLNHCPFSLEILKPDMVNLTLDKAHNVLMNASTVSFELKKYIVERLAKAEEKEYYTQTMKKRMEMGKNLLEESLWEKE